MVVVGERKSDGLKPHAEIGYEREDVVAVYYNKKDPQQEFEVVPKAANLNDPKKAMEDVNTRYSHVKRVSACSTLRSAPDLPQKTEICPRIAHCVSSKHGDYATGGIVCDYAEEARIDGTFTALPTPPSLCSDYESTFQMFLFQFAFLFQFEFQSNAAQSMKFNNNLKCSHSNSHLLLSPKSKNMQHNE